MFLITTLPMVPFTVLADPIVLLRTADEMDMFNISKVKKAKLSATLKIDKNGAMVVQCLNLFSIPVARTPLGDNPGIQRLAQRTRLRVEQKGRGVFVKLAFLF
jgi:predicted PilT family ATPase